MPEITITTQAELDALPQSFTEFTRICIKCEGWITVRKARENSHVEARENSHVVARENSHVEAWENSHVEARENSHVVARENSHVIAWENSHVVAWENSHVEAWENSHVEARENSHVEARGNVAVHIGSNSSTVLLFTFAVAWLLVKGAKAVKKSKFARTVAVRKSKNLAEWADINGTEINGKCVLFKRVSKEFQTQEGTSNATSWPVGEIVTHSAWVPKSEECGAGKFHACSQPFFCDEFRTEKKDDRYIAIEVARRDLYAWPNPDFQHKIAFRKGKVLYECDRYGKKTKQPELTSAI